MACLVASGPVSVLHFLHTTYDTHFIETAFALQASEFRFGKAYPPVSEFDWRGTCWRKWRKEQEHGPGSVLRRYWSYSISFYCIVTRKHNAHKQPLSQPQFIPENQPSSSHHLLFRHPSKSAIVPIDCKNLVPEPSIYDYIVENSAALSCPLHTCKAYLTQRLRLCTPLTGPVHPLVIHVPFVLLGNDHLLAFMAFHAVLISRHHGNLVVRSVPRCRRRRHF
jgi:hypothetical protein